MKMSSRSIAVWVCLFNVVLSFTLCATEDDDYTGEPSHIELNGDSSSRRLLQNEQATSRIARGERAPCGRYAYMASLRTHSNIHKCVGVLVNPQWVLTAAHCVDPQSPLSIGAAPIIVIGACSLDDSVNANGQVERFVSTQTMIHEEWTRNVEDGNDIALLKWNGESKHLPAQLPPAIHGIAPGSTLVALGWGIQENSNSTLDLQQATAVEIIRLSVCRTSSVWGSIIQDSMICALSFQGEDVCEGDSGRPLFEPFAPNGQIDGGQANLDVIVGITSFGPESKCGESSLPNVFTRVSSFKNWIDGKIKQPQPPGPPSSSISPSLERSMVSQQPSPPSAPAVVISPERQRQLDQDLMELAGAAESPSTRRGVRILLSKGANPNACCAKGGFTALHETAKEDNGIAAKALVANGANISTRSDRGWTPLHRAAQFDAIKVATVLVEAGADVDAVTNDGALPLNIATLEGSSQVAELLFAE